MRQSHDTREYIHDQSIIILVRAASYIGLEEDKELHISYMHTKYDQDFFFF